MKLKFIEIKGFKSFAKKEQLSFSKNITAIVGPNGSGKSNVAEAFRFVLGEQSMKSLRSKKTEDLLFNGSTSLPRTNRASVSLTFDNSNREIERAFDEIEIERIIHRDSTSEYYINGSPVRLKDVIDILSTSKIGTAGHNIISQGEADKMLKMGAIERREYVEEAIGLTQYRIKKRDALKKLVKTEENLVSVRSLAREHAPHLRYLEREMSQIEKRKELIEELKTKINEYAKLFLPHRTKLIQLNEKELQDTQTKIDEIDRAIKENLREKEAHSFEERREELRSKIQNTTNEIENLKSKRSEIERSIGRMEAKLEILKTGNTKQTSAGNREINSEKIDEIIDLLKRTLDEDSLEKIKETIKKAISIYEKGSADVSEEKDHEREDPSVVEELNKLNHEFEKIVEEENGLLNDKEAFEKQISELFQEEEKDRSKEYQKASLETQKGSIKQKIDSLKSEVKDFYSLLEEVVYVTGINVPKENLDPNNDITRIEVSNDDLREKEREVEKLKLRIETMQVGNQKETEREYKLAKERAEFLDREIEDLEKTIEKLHSVAQELDEKIEYEFSIGLKEISDHFSNFFSHMFAGGKAELTKTVVTKKTKDEEKLSETGVEIGLTIPNKKIKSIAMLSGGEKTLVSIALIFALSQVNPPPFLILDETDAALDEANSKRYAEALTELAKRSQLILITHNRETMSHAGMLYGITMGKRAASELLSVDLEEAEKITQ
ncbi:MAG: AAA family ATPase [Candidatus Campbellbacteria bacterium]|nr:AAA family ATPase [Candidatus Campbellbacteria bacterium]